MSEPLKNALELLQREFPSAAIREVRLEFRLGERPERSERWNDFHWRIQINNESAGGDSFAAALVELRKQLVLKAQIPERAERVAAILREVAYEGFGQHEVIMAAQAILEKERR